MPNPEFIYKIATPSAYAEAVDGLFAGMPIDARDGFIHLSTGTQLRDTLRLHFAGQANLLLIAVHTDDLGEKLRWEPSRGGELFPHLYGPMPLSAVAWTVTIAVGDDGSCELPEGVV